MIDFDDTIAAISTPAGEGGIGIIRISGPMSEKIAHQILFKTNGASWGPWEERRVYFGQIKDEQNQRLDEAIFFVFRAPRSYTKEEIVELQMHGNPTMLRTTLELILRLGARLAEPGEFTRRAFQNGRIDLTQAEGVIDLIRARTIRGGRIAADLMVGELSERIHNIRNQLIFITAEHEAMLDYPEDDIDPMERADTKRRLQEIINDIKYLLDQGMIGQYIREGITVVLAGRPNVGKSSLLNTLLRKERAIVTDIPGTTRDIIEEERQIKGIPVRLIDTAGLRESENLVEKIGIQRAEDWMNRADIILFILDGEEELTKEDWEIARKLDGKNYLTVVNKTDRPLGISEESLKEIRSDQPVIEVSAITRKGISDLEDAILRQMGIENLEPDREILLTHLRHKNSLTQCKQQLEGVIRTMSEETDDLLVIGLRSALLELGKITGEDMDEEVIREIFNNFCLGK